MPHVKHCVLIIIICIFINNMSATEVTITDWESRFAALEKIVQAQDARIQELEREIVTLKQGFSDKLKATTKHEEVIKQSAEDQSNGYRWKIIQNRMTDENDIWTKRTHTLLKQVDRAKPVFPRLLPGNNLEVAFQASIAEPYRTVTLNHDSTIIFDTTSLNIGGAYHAKHGLFIAPRAGIYLFSTSVDLISVNTLVHFDIEKNGEEIAGGIAFNSDGNHHQASVTALLNLVAGDEVYVNVERRDGMTIYGDKLTSFMGVLLYAL